MIRAVDASPRRTVLPRDADGRAVLVHRAGHELRLGAGAVGRDGQGRRDAEQARRCARASRRRRRRTMPAARRPRRALSRRRRTRASATCSGIRSDRDSCTCSPCSRPSGNGAAERTPLLRRRWSRWSWRRSRRCRRASRRLWTRHGTRASGADERAVHELGAAPFGPGDTKLIYEGSGRLTSVAYSADGKTMFVDDSGAVFAMRTADPSKKYNLGRGVTLAGWRRWTRRRRRCVGGRGAPATSDSTGGALATEARAERRAGRDRRQRQQDGLPLRHAHAGRATGTRRRRVRGWTSSTSRAGKRARVFDSPADAYDEFVTRARRRLLDSTSTRTSRRP